MTTHAPPTLESGWSAETSVEDTVLRHGLLALSSSWTAAGQACGARIARDERFTAVDVGRPTGLFNSATLQQPMIGQDLDDALEEIERFYDRQGHGTALLWSPWPTPDLTARGWTLEGHPPLLFRPALAAPPVRRPEELEVVEATTPAAFDEWRSLAVEAFPLDAVQPARRLLDTAILEDPRFRFVIGRADGRDVAVGCQFVECEANVLLLAATLPEFRGRGYYSALAADRITHQPDLPAVTIVSDDSRPVLVGRFGFLPISRFTLWKRPRP